MAMTSQLQNKCARMRIMKQKNKHCGYCMHYIIELAVVLSRVATVHGGVDDGGGAW